MIAAAIMSRVRDLIGLESLPGSRGQGSVLGEKALVVGVVEELEVLGDHAIKISSLGSSEEGEKY